MTIDRDPPRLLDPGTPAEPLLREVLQRVHASAPSAAELAALALKVDAVGSAPVQSLSAKAGALKLPALLLAAGTAAWFGHATLQPRDAERAPARPEVAGVAPAPVARAGGPVTSNARPAPAGPAGEGTPVPAKEPTPTAGSQPAMPPPARRASVDVPRVRPGSAPRPTRAQAHRASGEAAPKPIDRAPEAPAAAHDPAAVIPAATATELQLLGRAQRALARDAEETLALLEEHARAYPHGQYEQEREALAIDALRRLGHRAEMTRRATRFLRRFPASPHRDRIEAWLR